MAKCLQCEKSIPGKATICPACRVDMDKRSEFRALMDGLGRISRLEREERKFMHGFSYAEQENFSLIFRKLQVKFNFPLEFEDFVNSHAIKEAKTLYSSEYSEKLQSVLSDSDKSSLFTIKHKLMQKFPAGNAWDDASLSDVLCFCINQGNRSVDIVIPELEPKKAEVSE